MKQAILFKILDLYKCGHVIYESWLIYLFGAKIGALNNMNWKRDYIHY